MVRVAIVGCGKIADQHMQAISRIPGSSVVAACDCEILMARQLAERFSVEQCFEDAQEMLRKVTPNVVHITTPPQTHYDLARLCLNAGSHVYLEKPFTVNATECESLIAMANELDLCITAGHNYQFTPEMLEMRRLVEEGYLGGKPVHVESYFSYDLGDADYVRPMVANPEHWVRRLPGKLLHNIISHGIARLAEFISGDIAEVTASAWQSPRLASMGCPEVLDELRVLIRDRSGTSATFCFSTQIKPGLNRLNVLGSSNSLCVDMASGSLIRSVGRDYKSYLTFMLPALNSAREHLANAARNARSIVRARLYQDAGMKELIHQFHRSTEDASPPPIPHGQILLTARIMDEIFARIGAPVPRHQPAAHV